MPDITAPASVEDRCPQNPPDGAHRMKPPAVEGEPRCCSYCGATQSAAAALEVMAFNLATGSELVEPKDVRAAIARHRNEVLAEAIEAARGEYLIDGTDDENDKFYERGITDAICAIGALVKGGAQ